MDSTQFLVTIHNVDCWDWGERMVEECGVKVRYKRKASKAGI